MVVRKLFALGMVGVLIIVVLFVSANLSEYVDASELMVIQSPLSGHLTWYTSPGVKWQGLGKVTKYRKRDQFWFSLKTDQGKKIDESLQVRFNDGAHAAISGSIAWEMPIDEHSLTALHVRYGSHDEIQKLIVRPDLAEADYVNGQLMR